MSLLPCVCSSLLPFCVRKRCVLLCSEKEGVRVSTRPHHDMSWRGGGGEREGECVQGGVCACVAVWKAEHAGMCMVVVAMRCGGGGGVPCPKLSLSKTCLFLQGMFYQESEHIYFRLGKLRSG